MANNREQSINVPMILISAVAAALAWFLIHGMKALLMGLGGPLAIGIISTLFLAAMGVVVLLVSRLMGTYRADVMTGYRNQTKFLMSIVSCMIVCLVLMFGFEWLYERDVKGGTKGAGTYVFVVDDSGSTAQTDPDQLRFQAIRTIMQEKDPEARYAIYSFANDVSLLQPMQKVSDGIPQVQGVSNGGTSIKAALDRVITDYEQGVWDAKGGVRVILITDGHATDILFKIEMDPILKRYRKNNIPVSSVGLGDVDAELLTRIAEKTEGEFIDITQVDQMSEAVKSVATISGVKRDLFSDRPESSSGLLPAIMRILFVGILGVLIAVAEAIAYGNSSTISFIISVGAVKAFLASTILELGICAVGLPAGLVSLIAMTIIGTVVAQYGKQPDFGSSPSEDEGWFD